MYMLQGYIWNVDSTTNNSGVLHSVGPLNLVLFEEVKVKKFILGLWGMSNNM